MAQRLDLGEAQVVLADSQFNIRKLIQEALRMIGFRKIEGCATIDQLRDLLVTLTPELILIDLDENLKDACGTIEDIRNRRLGKDPFAIIVALTWNPGRDIIRAALNAGTDDIVAKPISAQFLQDRVVNLIENRKEFVVSSDYVGPERRPDSRQSADSGLPRIKVPNRLRQTTAGDDAEQATDSDIEAAMRSVGVQKIFHLSREIAHIAGGMADAIAAESNTETMKDSTGRIAQHLGEVEAVAKSFDFGSLLPVLANTDKLLSDLVAAGEAATHRQVELLRLHALSIGAILKESEDSAGLLLSELERATSIVRAGGQTKEETGG